MTISRNYISSILLLVTAVIGVGMFALPYVATKAGLLSVLAFFIALGFVQHWLHKIYAEIILSTKQMHRLPGYAEKYLGKKSKKIVLLLSLLGGYGAMLVFTIVGGEFLYRLLNPLWGGGVILYTIALLLIRAAIMFMGFRWVTKAEVVLTGGLIGTILIVASLASKHGSMVDVALFNPDHFILAYGPVFFAVGGMVVINDICILLKNEQEKIKSALFWGLVVSISLMVLFVIIIISLSGGQTSPDALSGLEPYVSFITYGILLIIGLTASTTSFLATGEALEELYMWDFNISPKMAWLLVVPVPLILYMAEAHDLTKTVALVGAMSGGLLGAITLLIALKVKKKPERKSIINNKLTPLLARTVAIVFVIGLFYQLWEIFGT
ncbi:MAG: aromatic amino acid transport family protein [Patescibacteria group bacterium]|nr:MAG: aromatic amino acid transport family protein [Patescibacteria group bacterium]